MFDCRDKQSGNKLAYQLQQTNKLISRNRQSSIVGLNNNQDHVNAPIYTTKTFREIMDQGRENKMNFIKKQDFNFYK